MSDRSALSSVFRALLIAGAILVGLVVLGYLIAGLYIVIFIGES
jgi:hypothetical protein